MSNVVVGGKFRYPCNIMTNGKLRSGLYYVVPILYKESIFRTMQMKHYCSAFLLGFLLLCQIQNAQGAACVKSMRWVDAPPYTYKDENGRLQGLHVDLVQEALRRMNCNVRFIEMPWARAIVELERGRLDILAGAGDTKERKEFAFFSMPTNRARSILFLSNESAKKYQINKLTDVIGTNFRLAAQRDASHGDEYDTLIKKGEFANRMTYVHSPISGWLMMEKNRVDGQIADELAGMYRIKQLGLEQVIKPSKIVTSNFPDLVAFSKLTNDAQFVRDFDATLRSMIADGTYKEILARYLSCTINIKNLGCQ
jgi:polar amino acid transport system substrate-binding protein